MDFETQTWQAARTWTYTYEGGYPVLVDCHDFYEDTHTRMVHQYAFREGLPAERVTRMDGTAR